MGLAYEYPSTERLFQPELLQKMRRVRRDFPAGNPLTRGARDQLFGHRVLKAIRLVKRTRGIGGIRGEGGMCHHVRHDLLRCSVGH